MPGQEISSQPYISIVGGIISQKVDEGTEGARLRKYELPDGTKGEKWELRYKNWEGMIRNIVVMDQDFGDGRKVQQCNVYFDDVTMTLNTKSSYFQDLIRKLRNADLSKPVILRPYDFESKETGKRVTGLTVYQGGTADENKVYSYYWDAKEEKDTKDGFPQPEGDTNEYTSDDWTVYFVGVKKFLIEELKKLEFTPAIGLDEEVSTNSEGVQPEEGEDEVKIEDVPF